MADMRNELASVMADRYNELKDAAQETSVYEAICNDFQLYGESPDELLQQFLQGMDALDERLDDPQQRANRTREALERVMDEHDMDAELRYKFLSTATSYFEQAGGDELLNVLEGGNINVLRALLHMSEVKLCDASEVERMDEVENALINAVAGAVTRKPRSLDAMDEETEEELLRCYAAWCAMKDFVWAEGEAPENSARLIAEQVRAGQREAALAREEAKGGITGEQAAEAMKSVSEAVLTGVSLFISSAAGVLATFNIMKIVRLMFGVNGISLAIGLITGLPAGIKVTADSLKVCAMAGEWLEEKALEPAMKKTAELADKVIGCVNDNIAPAVKGAFDGVKQSCGGAYEGFMQGLDGLATGVRDGVGRAWNNLQPVMDNVGTNVVNYLENASADIYASLTRVLRAFKIPTGEGDA